MVRKQRRFKTPVPEKAGGSFPAGYLPAFCPVSASSDGGGVIYAGG